MFGFRIRGRSRFSLTTRNLEGIYQSRIFVYRNVDNGIRDGDSSRSRTRYEKVSTSSRYIPRQRAPHTVGIRHVRSHWNSSIRNMACSSYFSQIQASIFPHILLFHYFNKYASMTLMIYAGLYC